MVDTKGTEWGQLAQPLLITVQCVVLVLVHGQLGSIVSIEQTYVYMYVYNVMCFYGHCKHISSSSSSSQFLSLSLSVSHPPPPPPTPPSPSPAPVSVCTAIAIASTAAVCFLGSCDHNKIISSNT